MKRTCRLGIVCIAVPMATFIVMTVVKQVPWLANHEISIRRKRDKDISITIMMMELQQ